MVAVRIDPKRRHLVGFRETTQLTEVFYGLTGRSDAMVSPKKVIRALSEAEVRFILMGAHGLSGWRKESRSTKYVDVLVAKRDVQKATRALAEAFPKLEVVDTLVVTRFLHPKSKVSLIDIMKPVQEVFKLVFKNSIAVGETHRIPTLEMALVSKFAAMTSPHRTQVRKMQDGVDFITIAQNNLNEIDERKLRTLAERVYRGGGAEIATLIADIREDRPIRF